jgi:hypothetical protein
MGEGKHPILFCFLITAASCRSTNRIASGKHHSTHFPQKSHAVSMTGMETSISMCLSTLIDAFLGLYSPVRVAEQINSHALQPVHFSQSTINVFSTGDSSFNISSP